ncbi:MAG: TMEM143 family protein [Pseudomonadales bacterium]
MDLPEIEQEHFIPFRAADLLDLCLRSKDLAEKDKRRFEKICILMSRYFHLQFQVKLDTLKDCYAPFNPDSDTLPVTESTGSELKDKQAQLVETLTDVVQSANFKPVSQEDLNRAMLEHSLFNIRLNVDFDDFEQILFYRRGESRRTAEARKWYTWKKHEIEFTNFERVLVYVKFKGEDYFRNRDPKDLFFKPGTTMLKLFRNIPKADLEMLFPNTEVAMRVQDKIMIGVPAAVSGVVVLVTKLGSTVLLLGALFAFWLGWRDEPVFIDQTALVALGIGLASVGAYVWKQFNAFRNRKIKFMKVLADNLYFKNLDNNAGVFHRLIDAAEEAERKEVMLAYFFLVTAEDTLSKQELDEKIELWLRGFGSKQCDFEIDDALTKLKYFGLVEQLPARKASAQESEPAIYLKAIDLDTALNSMLEKCQQTVVEIA